MANGRSTYKVIVNAPFEQINGTIHQFLQANKFVPNPQGGQNYYTFHDPIYYGYRGFQYFISGNEVTVIAHVGQLGKQEFALEGGLQDAAQRGYRDALKPLFAAFDQLNASYAQAQPQGAPVYKTNMGGQSVYIGQPAQQQAMAQAVQTNTPVYSVADGNTFVHAEEKSNHGQAIAGFWIATGLFILLLLFLLFGYFLYIGAPLLIATIFLCVHGLHSDRKGMAIAGLCISGVDIFIVIIYIILKILSLVL